MVGLTPFQNTWILKAFFTFHTWERKKKIKNWNWNYSLTTLHCLCIYLNDGADPCGYEDQEAGLLIEEVEEDHDGAETSPQHWEKNKQHTWSLHFMGKAIF